MEQNTQVSVHRTHEASEMGVFASPKIFEEYQRMAIALSASVMIPTIYRGNSGVANCIIALDIAMRLKTSSFMVMQNLDIIEGRPSWKSSYLISVINTHPRFSGYLEFEFKELGKKTIKYVYWVGPKENRTKKETDVIITDISCTAWTMDRNNKRLEGTPVTVEMAVLEGWYTRPGSKWPTMTKQMLCYRAASFFNRQYCPETTLGMHAADEVEDFVSIEGSELKVSVPAPVESGKKPTSVNERLGKKDTPEATVLQTDRGVVVNPGEPIPFDQQPAVVTAPVKPNPKPGVANDDLL